MSANDKQVAGDHYATAYQHWDFVLDAELGYLLGCATKYVSRWRKKNGAQDLQKAIHYLEKAKEVGQLAPRIMVSLMPLAKFTESLEQIDARIVATIVLGDYSPAIKLIEEAIAGAG